MDLVNQFIKSASLGNVAEVEEFLNHGCSVDLQDSDGLCALHAAAANGANSVVSFLLSKNAFVDMPNTYGWTPLMFAARYGHTSTVTHLIERHARVNVYNKMGMTPLIAAVWSGEVTTIEVLLDNGAIADYTSTQMFRLYNVTPLMVASFLGYESIVRMLLEADSSVNCTLNITGWSPMMLASCKGHDSIFEILVENGADECQVDVCGRTAQEISYVSLQQEVTHPLEDVLVSNVDVSKFSYPEEKLLTAVRNGCLKEVIDIISDTPTCVNFANSMSNFSPLMLAAIHGHSDIVQALIKSGADIDAQEPSSGWTALMYAVHKRHYRIVKHLVAGGANIHITAKDGNTALNLLNRFDKSDKTIAKVLVAKITTSLTLNRPESLNSSSTIPAISHSRSFSFFPRLSRSSSRTSTRSKNWLSSTTDRFGTMFSRLSTRRLNSTDIPVIKIEETSTNDDVFYTSDGISQGENPPELLPGGPIRSPNTHLSEELKKHCVEPISCSFLTKVAANNLTTTVEERQQKESKKRKSSDRALNATNLLKNYTKNRTPGTPVLSHISKGSSFSDSAAYKKGNAFFGPIESLQCSGSTSDHLKLPEATSPSNNKNAKPSSLLGLLKEKSLEEHANKFKEHEIDTETFQYLKNEDFLNIGIDSTSSRKSLCEIVENLRATVV